MMTERRKKFTLSMFIKLIFFLFIFFFLYIGFYHPDPYALGRWPLLSTCILWGARILMPLAALAVLVYFRSRTARLELTNVALFLGSLIFALLIFYPVANYLYSSKRNVRHGPEQFHPYLQLAPTGIDAGVQSNENRLTIMCLGGSTTQFTDSKGIGWPGLLEENLKKLDPGRDVKVYNQGRTWYTTLHALINYETNLRRLRPDVLIVMHVINDLLQNADFSYFSHGGFREDYGHFYGPVTELVEHRGVSSFLVKMLGHYWYHSPRDTIEEKTFPGEVPFERNLNTLIDLAEKDGTRVILMTQPSLYQKGMDESLTSVCYMLNYEAVGPTARWSLSTAITGFERYNAIVRATAQKRRVTLIDLEMKIPKTLEYFKDEVHYKDKTFHLVADAVTKGLIEGGS